MRHVPWPCAGHAAHPLLCNLFLQAVGALLVAGCTDKQGGRAWVSATSARSARASAGLQRKCLPASHGQPRCHADALKLLCCCAQGAQALHATVKAVQGQCRCALCLHAALPAGAHCAGQLGRCLWCSCSKRRRSTAADMHVSDTPDLPACLQTAPGPAQIRAELWRSTGGKRQAVWEAAGSTAAAWSSIGSQ